jgi:two-component system LytT family response regulator
MTQPGPSQSLRVLIVDDEPLGRERIRSLLANRAEVTIAAECRHGREAVDAIRSHEPDLVFLDIQMPELDGFDVIQEIGASEMPPVIFVTAYDQHALQAFEVHAVDYLLKPFDVDRFEEAFERAADLITRAQQSRFTSHLDALLQELKPSRKPLNRLMIKTRSKYYFLPTDEIDWIEATGNYVTLHASGKRHLLRQTMGALEDQLDPAHFMRIHRSTIVRIDRVKELQATATGEYDVHLLDGTRLTLSRGYRHALDRFSS